ncbi:ribosome biogenesis GTPase Der [Candidatus Falkowbacteria bacterium]|nr:ribosome biogenesis GTPase Der [Candidatus Falkowbacteria bacterium]MBT5503622.1 ribosome biogenesis GTPase Der [Candidatus Falkowbacteria bacterium]MBT6574482.1 ribosome biogenesis GTPase Der [Candidatus Falkowbacteria bacterium]MBT7348106.1 ribosome biogenesis GTPase Der [Candidatus Falkowbacteria bacterium]MBT7500749.1 ribosome biogenesis GTPase Der [Candidatus Falkowbacteria bacterium]
MKEIKPQFPVIALIGRTNVGKSTIFNRLTENKQAIVSNIPGTTRDKRYGNCLWLGKTITLTDTAGLDVDSGTEIDKKAIDLAKKSITESDLNLLIVDSKHGLLPQDKEYAKLIKKSGKPVFLVINKVDSNKQMDGLGEFQKLAIKTIHPISAKTGAGTGDLLDDILKSVDHLKHPGNEETSSKNADRTIRIALIGKPNVGKSSLLNKIVGAEKSIVSSVPHTTRDSQDATIGYDPTQGIEGSAESLPDAPAGQYLLTFTDTAGIIKKRKVANKFQEMSIDQSIGSLKRSDIVLLLFDADQPITMQDKTLTQAISDNYKSIIFVVNKWDLVEEKSTHSDKDYIAYLDRSIPFLTWAPVIFISAKTGFKVQRLLDIIIQTYEKQNTTFEQTEIDEFLRSLLKKKVPPRSKGTKPPFIHTMKQTQINPLGFEFVANQSKAINYAYRRFIKKELRKKFNLGGCSIKLDFIEKVHVHGQDGRGPDSKKYGKR